MELGENTDPFALQPTIEDYVRDEMDVITDVLDDVVLALIDDETMTYNDVQVSMLSETLLTALDSRLATDSAARAVCYNGLRFGFLLADKVTPRPLDVPPDGVIDYGRSIDDQWHEIVGHMEGFPSVRPNIDILIGRYSQYIDPTGKYAHIMELAIGLALTMVESGESQRLIESAVDQLQVDITNLGGGI